MTLTNKPLPDPPPRWVIQAALGLHRALVRLTQALTPARFVMFDLVTGLARTHILASLARTGVADLLEQGPLTSTEIAERTKTNVDAIDRSLAMCAVSGVFRRDNEGRWHNTRTSRTLCSGPSTMRAFTEYFGSRSNAGAWASYDAILRSGVNGFEHTHGMSVWQWFDEHPEERETFSRAMMSITLADASAIARAFPWSRFPHVCDVGGGRGTLLAELLVREPRMSARLLDAPGVLDLANTMFETRGVSHRVTLTPGSFFDNVPHGADCYILKNVLHDWSDAHALRILRNVREAMTKTSRLAVIEGIVHPTKFEEVRFIDVQMMVACDGGRERTENEYRTLFEAAGLRLVHVWHASTPIAVLEAERVEM